MIRFSRIFVTVGVFLIASSQGEAQRSAKVSNNLFASYALSDSSAVRAELAFEFMYSDPGYWNESSLFVQYAHQFKHFLEVSGNLRYARTQQNKQLGSREMRPSLGIRFFSNPDKRWAINNRTLAEFRWLFYSNDQNDFTIRFRNRTTVSLSILQPAVSDDRNLLLYTFYEAFHNTESETVERFFELNSWKTGILYRSGRKWAFDVGFTYFNANNNAIEISNFPTIIDSNTTILLEIVVFILIYSITRSKVTSMSVSPPALVISPSETPSAFLSGS